MKKLNTLPRRYTSFLELCKRGMAAASMLVTLCLLAGPEQAWGQWTQISQKPGFTASTMLLLTDGSVLCQGYNSTQWKRLIPDAFGSYVNGTWTNVAPMTTPRLYFTSAVLADGRVFVAGGEYTGGNTGTETNTAQIYDPLSNTWTSEVVPLGWTQIGDGAGSMMADGRFLFGNAQDQRVAIFDPMLPWGTGAFTAAASKGDLSSEETWVTLPDGTIFTAQCQGSPGAERYYPATDEWLPMASVPAAFNLVEAASIEIGPAFLLPDGRVYYVGCTGHSALYQPGALSTDPGSWIGGPDFPNSGGPTNFPLGAKDAPGSWLPNGQVLVTVAPVDGNRTNYWGPVSFFLYTPGATNAPGTLTAETAAPNRPGVPYQGRMLLLPSGQVLYSGESDNVYAYSYTSGGPNPAWKPRITSWPGRVESNHTYSISGVQFNGVSQGANYGDDAEMQSNYPLLRITNRLSGHVFYCRTHHHSTMGVATGNATVSTLFDTPSNLEPGLSDMVVVANGIPSDPIVINGPAIVYNAENDLMFGTVCPGTSSYLSLDVYNVGAQDLIINGVQRVGGSVDFFVLPNPKTPITLSPGSHITFSVRYTPSAPGAASGIIRIASNDPNTPSVDITATGNGGKATIVAGIADSGNFGEVCVGAFKDLDLTINNSGSCDLVISGVSSSSAQFVVPNVLTFPLVAHAGDSLRIPVRFQPTTLGAKTGTIIITSNDPNTPTRMVTVSGTAPSGDIRVTGSTDFGDVCAGGVAEKTIAICNVGKCDLRVASVSFDPVCPDFTLSNNPFPAVVSHDSCLGVTIRFTPTSCGAKSCTLKIVSDDPDQPIINLTVTANTPCPEIDVPLDLGFLPEVIQNVGSCTSQLPFPISNKGKCNLAITSITIGGASASDFRLSGLPSFPIILQPGHIAGEGDLNVVFAPTVIDRNRQATITVTYVLDPVTGATLSVTRKLCGEGVNTGARVLVTQAGIPLTKVEKIHLQRINANRNRDKLDSQDQVMDAPLVTVVPAAPCEPFQYHREYGTVSNPIQLLPGSYQVTVQAIINGKRQSKVVGFDVQTCDFNPTVVVDF